MVTQSGQYVCVQERMLRIISTRRSTFYIAALFGILVLLFPFAVPARGQTTSGPDASGQAWLEPTPTTSYRPPPVMLVRTEVPPTPTETPGVTDTRAAGIATAQAVAQVKAQRPR